MKTWSVTQITPQRVPGYRPIRERPSGSMRNRSQVQGRAWQDEPVAVCYHSSTAVGNTQHGLSTSLLPVLSTPPGARWMRMCTKPDRSGQAVQHHRLARCDGGSALCAGEALILPYKCTADEQAPAHLSEHRPGLSTLRIHRVHRVSAATSRSLHTAPAETTGARLAAIAPCADVQRFYIPAHGSILAPSHGMTFSRDPPPVVLSTVESQNYSMSKPGKKSTRRPRCYRTVHKELGATVYTYSLPPSCFFHIGLARPRRVHRPERPTASRVCRPLT